MHDRGSAAPTADGWTIAGEVERVHLALQLDAKARRSALHIPPPPPLACGGQSPSPACGGQLSSSQLPVLCLPSRYGLFSDDDAPVMKAIDLVEFVAGEGAVTVWTKLFGVRCLCC